LGIDTTKFPVDLHTNGEQTLRSGCGCGWATEKAFAPISVSLSKWNADHS